MTSTSTVGSIAVFLSTAERSSGPQMTLTSEIVASPVASTRTFSSEPYSTHAVPSSAFPRARTRLPMMRAWAGVPPAIAQAAPFTYSCFAPVAVLEGEVPSYVHVSGGGSVAGHDEG